jgi:hypothetical protein
MWAALTQIGALIASPDPKKPSSATLLGAAGDAIAVALRGATASRKERREAERDARKGLREVLGLARDEQKEILEYAQAREIAELRSEESQAEREARIEEAAAKRQARIDTGADVIVGVNKYQSDGAEAEVEAFTRDPRFVTQKYLLIDARNVATYQAGHIPGALL